MRSNGETSSKEEEAEEEEGESGTETETDHTGQGPLVQGRSAELIPPLEEAQKLGFLLS